MPLVSMSQNFFANHSHQTFNLRQVVDVHAKKLVIQLTSITKGSPVKSITMVHLAGEDCAIVASKT